MGGWLARWPGIMCGNSLWRQERGVRAWEVSIVTNPGLLSSGVVLPEESLLKYVFSDACAWRSSGAVVTIRGTEAADGNSALVGPGLVGGETTLLECNGLGAGFGLDLYRSKRLDQYFVDTVGPGTNSCTTAA